MTDTYSSGTELFWTIHRARTLLYPCWTGLWVGVYLPQSACLLKWPGPVCYPGQANRFWAHADWLSALSGSRPGVEAVFGAQGEKRNAVEHTLALHL